MTQMTQVDVTLARAFKVYWSLAWRLAAFVAAPLAALGTGVFRLYTEELHGAGGPLSAAGVSADGVLAVSLVAGLALLVVMPLCIVRRVLRHAYSDFRIVLEGPPRRLRIEPQLDATADKRVTPARRTAARRIEPTFDLPPRRGSVPQALA